MASVGVSHSLGNLRSDFKKVASETRPRMRGVVRDGVKVGTTLSRGYAKEASGPHGKNYYKRITGSMDAGLGLFGNTISGSYGPVGIPKTDFVGAGFRHGHNTDLPRSADIVGPSLLRSVDDEIQDMFRGIEFR